MGFPHRLHCWMLPADGYVGHTNIAGDGPGVVTYDIGHFSWLVYVSVSDNEKLADNYLSGWLVLQT